MCYTTETIKFFNELPTNTQNGRWSKEFLKRYQQFVRDPSKELAERIGERLSVRFNKPMKAGFSVPTNMGHGYKDHFVFAFYDPRSKAWKESVQLFFFLDARRKRWYYGFSVWCDISQKHLDRFTAVLNANSADMSELLRRAPKDTVVQVAAIEGDEQASSEGVAEDHDPNWPVVPLGGLADRWARGGSDIAESSGLSYGITVKREFKLNELLGHADKLAEEVGDFFEWAMPLFEASCSGVWRR
jgi:hypothetical protein